MKYQRWSQEELQSLYNSVQKQTNSRIDWKLVAKDLIGRTSQQCKSMFINVIRKNKQLQQRLDNILQKNNQIYNIIEQKQKGKLYLITKYFNEDYTLIQKNYFKDFTVEQIKQIYTSLQYEYMKHQFLLDVFEKQDVYQYIPQKELSFYSIAQLYNTVKICQYVVENQWYKQKENISQQVKLFPVKSFLDINNIDMLETKMLQEIYSRRNVKQIEQNIKQFIKENFKQKQYQDIF